ncbi:hypothetical protein AYO49_02785 [Verrucomicrobiaceae bacterium SCGC AG-212-N21]|nr:hypothetical protein AYO49_02785 [Verrucomicrobiaceae bacterium SCGC AG-212-N21]
MELPAEHSSREAHINIANMKTKLQSATVIRGAVLLVLAASATGLVSCASDDGLEGRLERRNERYSGFQDRRESRQDARQERTDAWFDRVMH